MKNLILGAVTIFGVYFIWKIGNGKTIKEAIDDLKSTNTNGNLPQNTPTNKTEKKDEKAVLAVNNLGYNEMPYVMNVSPNMLQDYSIDTFDINSNNKVLTIEKDY